MTQVIGHHRRLQRAAVGAPDGIFRRLVRRGWDLATPLFYNTQFVVPEENSTPLCVNVPVQWFDAPVRWQTYADATTLYAG